MVTVEVAPGLATGVTGVVPVTLHTGSGEPLPATVHVRLTGEAYPSIEVRVIVEVPLAPGETVAGVVAAMVKSGTATSKLRFVD
jgi:hypothetical protein